jgi:hypothetical protein
MMSGSQLWMNPQHTIVTRLGAAPTGSVGYSSNFALHYRKR